MITSEHYGFLDGKKVELYTLSDKITAKVVTLGATLIALEVPNAQLSKTDVLLGMTCPEKIISASYMGQTVGRCANRIGGASFTLDGKVYNLAQNDHEVNCLHGGAVGFNKKIFSARIDGDSLVLSLTSPDGDENFPANVNFSVRYTVHGSVLSIDYYAESDGTTVLNPTNHSYFNLNGQDDGNIGDNVLQIFADKFLPIDDKLIPTGEVRSVYGTPFDFTEAKEIGRDIDNPDEQLKIAGGYDHNYCLLVRKGSLAHAARAYSKKTGIVMDCFTDMCGVQFYSGNSLKGQAGKSIYNRRSGFCLETQFWPNSVNMPKWEMPILNKGEKFHSTTQYIFGLL